MFASVMIGPNGANSLDTNIYECLNTEGTWHLVRSKNWPEDASWIYHDCPSSNAKFWVDAHEIVGKQCRACGEAMPDKIIVLWKLFSLDRISPWLAQAEKDQLKDLETTRQLSDYHPVDP
jgi:hypothetical protein